MFKELRIMRNTLKYLLIVVMLSVASLVFATAQSFAQKPEAQMKSTSGMVYSGSSLPQAATTGTYVTGTSIGTYSPASGSGPHRAKRDVGGGEDDMEDESDPDNPGEPNPIGDAAIPLLMLAAAYALLRVYKRKRSV